MGSNDVVSFRQRQLKTMEIYLNYILQNIWSKLPSKFN